MEGFRGVVFVFAEWVGEKEEPKPPYLDSVHRQLKASYMSAK
jgi:hypothetical protein